MIATEHLIALLATPGLGRRSVQKAIEAAGRRSPKTSAQLQTVVGKIPELKTGSHLPTREDLQTAILKARQVMDEAHRLGVTVIGIGEKAFPPQLRAIPDPPVVIYAKGDVTCLNSDLAVAVVGTRKPTSEGKRAAARFGLRMAEDGIVVVSGLALGCDREAHEGCLSAKGRTVAVLAHGIDTVYPAKNRDLATRIVKQGGCLVSEYPPGEKAQQFYFIDRDRIQSGLSSGVIVVETAAKGGTMHTARFCIAQRRVLGCWWRGEKHQSHPNMQGNRRLIEEQHALAIAHPEDLPIFVSKAEQRSRELLRLCKKLPKGQAHRKVPSPRSRRKKSSADGVLFPEENKNG